MIHLCGCIALGVVAGVLVGVAAVYAVLMFGPDPTAPF